MPKIVDYPRASFQRALDLANGVHSLGGSCTVQSAADSIDMKVGGGYLSVQSAAIKHGLLDKEGDQLSEADLYKNYRLAYSEEEENAVLKEAFLNVPLYAQVFERFAGHRLPEKLDRLLIREFDVPDKIASRVAKYIVESANELGLVDASGRLIGSSSPVSDHSDHVERTSPAASTQSQRNRRPDVVASSPTGNPVGPDSYVVHVKGPGLDMAVQIDSEFDISLVEMLMQKVKRKLQDAEAARIEGSGEERDKTHDGNTEGVQVEEESENGPSVTT